MLECVVHCPIHLFSVWCMFRMTDLNAMMKSTKGNNLSTTIIALVRHLYVV